MNILLKRTVFVFVLFGQLCAGGDLVLRSSSGGEGVLLSESLISSYDQRSSSLEIQSSLDLLARSEELSLLVSFFEKIKDLDRFDVAFAKRFVNANEFRPEMIHSLLVIADELGDECLRDNLARLFVCCYIYSDEGTQITSEDFVLFEELLDDFLDFVVVEYFCERNDRLNRSSELVVPSNLSNLEELDLSQSNLSSFLNENLMLGMDTLKIFDLGSNKIEKLPAKFLHHCVL